MNTFPYNYGIIVYLENIWNLSSYCLMSQDFFHTIYYGVVFTYEVYVSYFN